MPSSIRSSNLPSGRHFAGPRIFHSSPFSHPMKNTRSRKTVTRLTTIRVVNNDGRGASSAAEQGTFNHLARIRGRGRDSSRDAQQINEGGRAPTSPVLEITRSPVPLYAERARRTPGFFWLADRLASEYEKGPRPRWLAAGSNRCSRVRRLRDEVFQLCHGCVTVWPRIRSLLFDPRGRGAASSGGV